MSAPTDRELVMARAIAALLRAHEDVADPHTWYVEAANWGDGRTTFEVRDIRTYGPGTHEFASGLVCQFRPDEGTREDADLCIAAARAGAVAAAIVLRDAAEQEIAEGLT